MQARRRGVCCAWAGWWLGPRLCRHPCHSPVDLMRLWSDPPSSRCDPFAAPSHAHAPCSRCCSWPRLRHTPPSRRPTSIRRQDCLPILPTHSRVTTPAQPLTSLNALPRRFNPPASQHPMTGSSLAQEPPGRSSQRTSQQPLPPPACCCLNQGHARATRTTTRFATRHCGSMCCTTTRSNGQEARGARSSGTRTHVVRC